MFEGSNVKMKGRVGLDVKVDRGDDTLQYRARFFRASASDAEDDESSIVSPHTRFSERFFLRCALRLFFCVGRCARVREDRTYSTQQLLSRACMS